MGGSFPAAAPTHWSFGQLCSLAGPGNSPASYFRDTRASTDEGYLCSSRWAGGIFHVSYHDVKLSPDDLLAAINRQTGVPDERRSRHARARSHNALRRR